MCDYCKEEFEGVNEKQVDSQIAIHKLYKHRDKLNIREVKDEQR